ncbi:MAG: FtsW/RodA/SpoVE family cell cycle protein, partial [Planctomycetota bacterium]
KWAMVLLLAWVGASGAARLGRFWTGFLPATAAVGLVAAVIMKEDLGTAILVGGVGMIVLVGAGARLVHLAIIAPIGLGVVAAGLLAAPYRVARVTAFLDPFQDAQGTGYHMIQSMGAVAGGEVVGRGLGHGLQKFGYLPEDTTDFIFAIVCEELGLPGAAVVLFLYAVLIGLLLGVARGSGHPVHRLIALGVLATIGLQASINLLVVTGLAPTKGIALPLISKGGTGWILTCLSLGLIAAIDRAAETAEAQQPEPERSPAGRSAPGLPA